MKNKIDITNIRKYFPFFSENKDIYFDSASTTQKPQPVINATLEGLKRASNIYRGNYPLANELEGKVEETKDLINELVNDKGCVHFTSGSSDSFYKLALIWGIDNLKDGDEVMICPKDHTSATLPWHDLRHVLQKQGINIKIIPYELKEDRSIDIEDIKRKVSDKTKAVIVTHIHHIYGVKNDLREVKNILPKEAKLIVDAAQSISHTSFNNQEYKADAIVFSGHKMFASTGVGVLWLKNDLADNLKKNSILGRILQLGTPPIIEIISLRSSIKFINLVTLRAIEEYNRELTRYLRDLLLKNLSGIKLISSRTESGLYGIVSFNLPMLASDFGKKMAAKGVMLRAEGHCVLPQKSDKETIRVSLHLYNTKKEVDKFIELAKEITGGRK